MLEKLLSKVFPPSLGSLKNREVKVWQPGVVDFDEGYCGEPQPKKYRNGIERVRAEGV